MASSGADGEGGAGIYLDYQATTPMGEGPQRACADALKHAWGNPSSGHHAGRRAKEVRQDESRRTGRKEGERGTTEMMRKPLHTPGPLMPQCPGYSRCLRLAKRPIAARESLSGTCVYETEKERERERKEKRLSSGALACLPSTAAPPSSSAQVVTRARQQVADMLNARRPEDIVFTSGGTEGNNLVLFTATRLQGETRPPTAPAHIVTTTVEHDSVENMLQHLEATGWAQVSRVAPRPPGQGGLHPEDIVAALRPETTLVTLMLANNETGTIFPVGEVATAVKAWAKGRGQQVLVHTDAAQVRPRAACGVGWAVRSAAVGPSHLHTSPIGHWQNPSRHAGGPEGCRLPDGRRPQGSLHAWGVWSVML